MEDEEIPRSNDEINNEQFNQEMQELNGVFSRFKDDPDLDYVSLNRLTEVLQAFGRNPSIRDSEERISEMEAIGKFELTFEDVLQLLDEPWTVINNDRETLREALEKFDEKKEGYIDIDRFRTAMSTLGEPLSDEDVDALIQLGVNDEQTKINIDQIVDQLLGISA